MYCLVLTLTTIFAEPNKTAPNTNTLSNPHAHTNRLSLEKSPYLLQHQHNPVDWHAWGTEAFELAKAQNKPIFLSIGYSTCHWCHVMERESFENQSVADVLNSHFISIKVDREERPDVDRIYMTFVQSTTGQGGWPLNCFLTPELKPFYGGTYFPPEGKYGRPSFTDLLKQIAQLWETRKTDILDSAAGLHEKMEIMAARNSGAAEMAVKETLLNAALQFKHSFDPVNGGFGNAPKFPQPSQPEFLLNIGSHFKDEEAIRMVLKTCDHMANGGIHDQIGGGFARYSVDAEWLVPHFEKMLYDNAQLLDLYLDAYLVSGEKRYADTARSIIEYVLRDMTHSDGGFYSAEDADSEGKEGKFYCWTFDELSHLLTPEEFNVARKYYGITKEGNFVDHSDPNPLPGQNVLSIVDSHLSVEDQPLISSVKSKLMAVRVKRVRPHLDDKILSSWNGQMLGAMSRAYAILGDDSCRKAAEKNVTFIRSKLWDPKTGTLYHRWRDGQRDSVQLLQAYAYQLAGVLELYQATLESEHLQFANEIANSLLMRFEDREEGGFWQSSADAKDLILRVKEDYDGAEPSGASVATLALLKLSSITGDERYKNAAERTLKFHAKRLREFPQAMPFMLLALSYYQEEPRRVVVAGDPKNKTAQMLVHQVNAVYQPNKVVMGTSGPVEEFSRNLPAKNGSLVYICTGKTCQQPTADAKTLRKLLSP